MHKIDILDVKITFIPTIIIERLSTMVRRGRVPSILRPPESQASASMKRFLYLWLWLLLLFVFIFVLS